jgi:pyrroloquinoline quinone (PQQ) biosynthesis protein C
MNSIASQAEDKSAVQPSYSKILELTPHTGWAAEFWQSLTPLKDQVANHPFFQDIADGKMTHEGFKYALLNLYPLVGHFPSYMALNLAKAIRFEQPGVLEARNWLIRNIKTEERHLFWYRDWAEGFGVPISALNHVTPPPAMNAVNHFLWNINTYGTLAEGIAATNLAIEWATGDWTIKVFKGMQAYADKAGMTIDTRTLAWLRAHAQYDDEHPHEAMELIKRLCDHDPVQQEKARHAAEQGLGYYHLAIDHCYGAI